MRCESGELDAEIGQWWTDFISGDPTARETLLTQGGTKERSPRKRRRRGGAKRKTGEAAVGAESAGADGSSTAPSPFAGAPARKRKSENRTPPH